MTQLGKLQAEKKKVEAKITGHRKMLGELHSSIRTEARRIKEEETSATEQHNALMTEQHMALKESVGSQMQHRMDKLTLKLAKERSLRESLESNSNKQKVAERKTVAQLSAKLHAADAAAVAVIQEIKGFIRRAPKRPAHTGNAAKRDLRLARRQQGELGGLEKRAERKLRKSRSKLKLARASMVPRAVRLARRLQDKAEEDLRKVRAAMRKVRSRERGDERKLRRIKRNGRRGSGSTDVSAFAQRILSKWEHVHRLAFQEQKPSSNNNQQLEQRIAALEAALRSEGSKMHQMEVNRIQAQIKIATKKMRLMEEKMSILRKIYASAKSRGDKHGMIKAGTEEKDLSVACDKQKKLIQDLYRKLKAAQNAPAPKVPSVSVKAPKEEKAEKPKSEKAKKPKATEKESLIRAKERALRKAKREAKSSNQRMKAAKSHLKTAMKEYKKREHKREKRAQKEAKAAAKDHATKTSAVKKAQAELDAAKKKWKTEKKAAKKKAKKLKRKLKKEKAVQKKAEKKQAKLKKEQDKLKKKSLASKKKADKLAAKAKNSKAKASKKKAGKLAAKAKNSKAKSP